MRTISGLDFEVDMEEEEKGMAKRQRSRIGARNRDVRVKGIEERMSDVTEGSHSDSPQSMIRMGL